MHIDAGDQSPDGIHRFLTSVVVHEGVLAQPGDLLVGNGRDDASRRRSGGHQDVTEAEQSLLATLPALLSTS
ncbi:hypothetical protein [Roseomonas genomospecies 6]|uniref:hypothetical protein n=1 Tax=Roseomonas genomospecies 6 TaxID=214106 RepID=UPI0011F09D1D|nr:hypothetical protein [Roseomonas genomospecies 6]